LKQFNGELLIVSENIMHWLSGNQQRFG